MSHKVIVGRAVGFDRQQRLTHSAGPERAPRGTKQWPNLKQAVKGMKEIIDLAREGRLPPLGEPTD